MTQLFGLRSRSCRELSKKNHFGTGQSVRELHSSSNVDSTYAVKSMRLPRARGFIGPAHASIRRGLVPASLNTRTDLLMNFLRSPSNEGHHPKRVGYRPKRHPRRGRADPPRAGPRTVRGRDGAPLAPRGLLGRRIARASQPRSRGLQPLGALLPRQRRTCEKRSVRRVEFFV